MTIESPKTLGRLTRMQRRLLALGHPNPFAGITHSADDRKERLRAAIIAGNVAEVEVATGVSFESAFAATFGEPLIRAEVAA
jgi:hypothetical protein